MSYILDALNKSEEEKKQHRTPGLNTIHQSSEGRKTRRGPLLLIGIGLLIINLIALLIWWIFFSVAPEARDAGSISMQPTTSKPPPRVDSQRQSNTGTNNRTAYQCRDSAAQRKSVATAFAFRTDSKPGWYKCDPTTYLPRNCCDSIFEPYLCGRCEPSSGGSQRPTPERRQSFWLWINPATNH